MGLRTKELSKSKGITLVALVVTIIVLLILAGISITLLFGEEGIIYKAIETSKRHEISRILEKLEIEKGNILLEKQENITIEKYLEHIVKQGIIDKEDIKDTENENVKNIIVENKYVFLVEEEENGNIKITYEGEVTKLKPGSLVLETEKDNYEDGESKATVPAGFAVSGIESEQKIANGLVIYEIPKEEIESVDWSSDTNKNGILDVQEKYNQFVWVPCTISGENGSIKYDRYAFTRANWQYGQNKGAYHSASNSYKIERKDYNGAYYYYETMPQVEQTSIEKYNGYYIGRYEAGRENDKVVSKRNQNVYNLISMTQAQSISENAYIGKSVKSRICSSYSWDTALKFMETKNSSYVVNTLGGNYNSASGGTGNIENTGYANSSMCNIHDMGGNVDEWTTEKCTGISDRTIYYVYRGGDCMADYLTRPAAVRNETPYDSGGDKIGFRLSLFL